MWQVVYLCTPFQIQSPAALKSSIISAHLLRLSPLLPVDLTRGFPLSAGCIGSFISSREPQPTMQPLGHVGSSAGGGAASPKLHWHSCVSKLGDTRSGRPRLPKSSCAGSLHELRQMPLQLDSCRNLHFSTSSPPSPPSERRLTFAGPTRKPKAYGDTSDVSRGA